MESLMRPLSMPLISESNDAIRKYADVWSRVMLFILRAGERLESELQMEADGLLAA